ncbi:MAG: flagellar export chaperone FlgN [Lachnospiraceae bacterium]|nr:flagellar export chaperone FlgN [Lachnospiraceae bacterium]
MDQNQYLNILIESLANKIAILDEIIGLNNRQSDLIGQEEFDMETFDQIVTLKAGLIEKLDLLDSGFEGIYDRIRQELALNKAKYVTEISELQKLIARVTDQSASIQASEERNRQKIEEYFRNIRASYKSARVSVKAASTYYKAMSNLNTVDPQLMDKKK